MSCNKNGCDGTSCAGCPSNITAVDESMDPEAAEKQKKMNALFWVIAVAVVIGASVLAAKLVPLLL